MDYFCTLTDGIILPQIHSFLLILETEDFDSINSNNPHDLLEQGLLTRSALLVRGARSHHLSQSVQPSTVSQLSFLPPAVEAIASGELIEINSPCHL